MADHRGDVRGGRAEVVARLVLAGLGVALLSAWPARAQAFFELGGAPGIDSGLNEAMPVGGFSRIWKIAARQPIPPAGGVPSAGGF